MFAVVRVALVLLHLGGPITCAPKMKHKRIAVKAVFPIRSTLKHFVTFENASLINGSVSHRYVLRQSDSEQTRIE
jgi:hypothetical protein